jgi:hypothetical protein
MLLFCFLGCFLEPANVAYFVVFCCVSGASCFVVVEGPFCCETVEHNCLRNNPYKEKSNLGEKRL